MTDEKPLWEKFYDNWLEGNRTGMETSEDIFRAGFEAAEEVLDDMGIFTLLCLVYSIFTRRILRRLIYGWMFQKLKK